MKRRTATGNHTHSFSFAAFGGWIVLCELVGVAASVFTVPQITTWYATLAKPVFSPPDWIFGPAWITLYALMGYAAYRISSLGWDKPAVRKNLIIFLIHLVFNFLWSYIFFGLHSLIGGFIDIAIMWMFIMYLTWQFEKIDKPASYVMIPYLLWVSFAMLLNYSVWILNR